MSNLPPRARGAVPLLVVLVDHGRLPSPVHVAKVAAKFPGASGYLAADQMTSDVQAVAVDGAICTDLRYNIVTP